ncbi:histone H1-like [Halictus rubicundus]|uniref:histone H1-like n=1 Tax=Halictus rubicundus TaxID=77578 RepID=UPI0040352EE2
METKVSAGSAVEGTVLPVKKIVKSKLKVSSVKPYHPSTADMVKAAIKELKDRKGSSLQAIKKYISTTYKTDGDKWSPFIKRYLKTALTSGAVVQTSGKGASGSFKLPVELSSTKAKGQIQRKKPVKKVGVVKKAAETPVALKKPLDKKPATLKRNTKATTAIKMRTISKAKKTVKGAIPRTKAPKPKKVIARKSRTIGRKYIGNNPQQQQ